MDSLKSSTKNFGDYIKDNKLIVGLNLIGFGAIGFYVYKKFQNYKSEELHLLNKVKLESR